MVSGGIPALGMLDDIEQGYMKNNNYIGIRNILSIILVLSMSMNSIFATNLVGGQDVINNNIVISNVHQTGFFENILINTGLYSIIGLQSSYAPGSTISVHVYESLLSGKQCSQGGNYLVLELYNSAASSQSISSYVGMNRASLNNGGSLGSGSSWGADLSYTIPSSATAGTWSVSGYILCPEYNPSSASTYSSVNEQNFNIAVPCTPNWQTGAWSTCSGGTQTRTVTDSNSCGTTSGQPTTSQSCTSTPTTCTSWTYSDWGTCTNNQQTRTITSSSPSGCTGGNPAPLSQSCTSTTVQCSSNTQCGGAQTGNYYCKSNSQVAQDLVTPTCNQQGTTASYCSNSTTTNIIQTCSAGNVCQNGACTAITCSSNDQCGSTQQSNYTCNTNNQIVQTAAVPICSNPGTPQSTCSKTSTTNIIQTCSSTQTCSNGACVSSTCSTNSQCTPTTTPQLRCDSNNNVVQDTQVGTCNGIGTLSTSCSVSTTTTMVKSCGSMTCSNGACITPTTSVVSNVVPSPITNQVNGVPPTVSTSTPPPQNSNNMILGIVFIVIILIVGYALYRRRR